MNLKAALIPFFLLVLVGILAVGLKFQHQQMAEIKALVEAQTSDNSNRTQLLQQEISRVRTHIDQQSALISRAFGDVIPIPLPEVTERRLSEIEALLESPSSWPTDQQAVEVQFNELGALMEDIPNWVQEEMFPRIVPARWSLDTLWYLRASASDEDTRLALLESLEALDRNRPRRAPLAIGNQLTERIGQIRAEINDADRLTAEQAIQAGLSTNATLEQMLAALDILSSREDNPSSDDAKTIEQRIAIYVFQDTLTRLGAEFDRAQMLYDEELQIVGLTRVSEAFVDLRLRIATASKDDPLLNERIGETSLNRDVDNLGEKILAATGKLQQAAEEKRSEASRSYQVWALEQMRNVRQYSEILDIELQKIPSTFDRNYPAGAARTNAVKTAQRMLRQEMIGNLSIIDVSLLDVAVSEWFRKIYADRFDALSDKEEQLELVRGFARSQKTAIGQH